MRCCSQGIKEAPCSLRSLVAIYGNALQQNASVSESCIAGLMCATVSVHEAQIGDAGQVPPCAIWVVAWDGVLLRHAL